jgi:hypothetical protein
MAKVPFTGRSSPESEVIQSQDPILLVQLQHDERDGQIKARSFFS